jgi:DNA-binding transcriptional MerR regulator
MQRPRITDKLMLTIDQISQLTGVPKYLLRYWEQIFGDFLKPARTQTNRRKYTMEELYLVKTIKQLVEKKHLTAHGVRLRLRKILANEREKEARRQAKFKTGKSKTVRKRPVSSAAGDNPSVK